MASTINFVKAMTGLPALKEAVNARSWFMLDAEDAMLAAAIKTEIESGATPEQVYSFIKDQHAGFDGLRLAQMCRQAAEYQQQLNSE